MALCCLLSKQLEINAFHFFGLWGGNVSALPNGMISRANDGLSRFLERFPTPIHHATRSTMILHSLPYIGSPIPLKCYLLYGLGKNHIILLHIVVGCVKITAHYSALKGIC